MSNIKKKPNNWHYVLMIIIWTILFVMIWNCHPTKAEEKGKQEKEVKMIQAIKALGKTSRNRKMA